MPRFSLTADQIKFRDEVAMEVLSATVNSSEGQEALFQDRNQCRMNAPKMAEVCYIIADAMLDARGV